MSEIVCHIMPNYQTDLIYLGHNMLSLQNIYYNLFNSFSSSKLPS